MTGTAVQHQQGAKEFGWRPFNFYHLQWLTPLSVIEGGNTFVFD